MNRKIVIASEFGFQIDPETPVFEFQQLSEAASARREKRIEAAEKGLIYTG